jgi:hypothetical protein
LDAPWKGTCYIDGYPHELRPNILLEHFDPKSWCLGRDWLHRYRTFGTIFQYHLCQEPLVLLSNFIQVLFDTQVTS